jgi:hypothetical protein
MHTIFWLENLKGRDHKEDLGIDGNIICIRMDLREMWWKGVDWLHWLRIGTIGQPL